MRVPIFLDKRVGVLAYDLQYRSFPKQFEQINLRNSSKSSTTRTRLDDASKESPFKTSTRL
jgi:hypothetical protein